MAQILNFLEITTDKNAIQSDRNIVNNLIEKDLLIVVEFRYLQNLNAVKLVYEQYS